MHVFHRIERGGAIFPVASYGSDTIISKKGTLPRREAEEESNRKEMKEIEIVNER